MTAGSGHYGDRVPRHFVCLNGLQRKQTLTAGHQHQLHLSNAIPCLLHL